MDPDNERHENTTPSEPEPNASERASSESDNNADTAEQGAREIGGRAGPDPARYGDWEKNGRCIDF